MPRRTLMLAAFLLLPGCQARIPEGKFRCDAVSSCPDDWQCRAGYCYQNTSAFEAGVSAEDAGAPVRDAGPPVAGSAADGGAAGAAGASPTPAPDAGVTTTGECVLGEASLGACVLP